MKKNITNLNTKDRTNAKIKSVFFLKKAFIISCLILFFGNYSWSQVENIPCTGYNADVVANGVETSESSTTAALDVAGYVLVSNDFNPGNGVCNTANSWPATVTSLVAPNPVYTLQAANGNNSLRLTGSSSGTLTVTTPVACQSVYVLATSGQGAGNYTAIVTFSDNSTETFAGISVPDWCNASGANRASIQFWRNNRDASTSCGGDYNPYMFQSSLPIAATNQSKTIESIDFTNNTSGTILNVFAIAKGPTVISYCSSQGNNYSDEHITNINYAGINNTTVGSNYTDFTAQTANVTIGTANNLSVTILAYGSDHIYAWIDWDQDGSFGDVDESYIVGSNVSEVGPHTVSITPPAGAALGTTRMRVSVKYNGAPSSCETFSYGEVEDYSVNVTTATPCTSIPVLDATTAATTIGGSGASSGGNITSAGTGGCAVTARGVCWGTTSNPTVGASNFTTDGTGIGAFTSTITGLSPNTIYYVRSYATNGFGTAYGTEISFTTLDVCVPVTLFSEGFEGGALPTGWSQGADLSQWIFNASGNNGANPDDAHGGSNNALFKDESNDENFNTLSTPSYDLTGCTDVTLTFWHTQEIWGSDQDKLSVYYKTSSGGAWVLLASYTTSIASWTEEIIPLPNVNGTYYIGFKGNAVWGYGVCLDDVNISGCKTCTTPATPATATATATGQTTADLSWTAGTPAGSATVTYYWEVLEGATVKKSGSTTGTSASVIGLICNTTYTFTVYAKTSCDDSQSTTATSSSFTTSACDACVTPATPATAAVSNITTTGANLAWTAGSPVGSETVTYYWAVGTGSNVTYESGYTVRGSTTSLSATTAGLTCGTSYYLAVKATTDCNNTSSGYKTSNVFTTSACDACVTPATPATATVSNITTTDANLAWTAGSPVGSETVTYYWAVGTGSNVTYESGYTVRGSTTS
ncbi:MAG: GEVED domain-containing protein, partial [Bacteroidales bacterium]|nr:GEVED domain-containing protein [Bacteroidales bacterium]